MDDEVRILRDRLRDHLRIWHRQGLTFAELYLDDPAKAFSFLEGVALADQFRKKTLIGHINALKEKTEVAPVLRGIVAELRTDTLQPAAPLFTATSQPTPTAPQVMRDKAFLAMPYRPELKWVRNAIAAACRKLKIDLISVDEQVAAGDIIAGIHQHVRASSFGYVVLSGL